MMSSPSASSHARTVLEAQAGRSPIASLSESDPDLDLPAAYRVAAEVRRQREARGERVVGRKIGFTNTRMWVEYGVHAPIWGYVYDTTFLDRAALTHPLPLSPFVEPKIEPEIVFGLSRAPEPGMDARALVGCIAWAAQGFEVVQSLFPGWRFSAPDTVAAFGLHGTLVVGPRVPIGPGTAQTWAGLRFRISRSRCSGTTRPSTMGWPGTCSAAGRWSRSHTSSRCWPTTPEGRPSTPARSSPPGR